MNQRVDCSEVERSASKINFFKIGSAEILNFILVETDKVPTRFK